MSKRSRRHEQEPAQPAEEQAMEQAQEAQPQEETAAADPAPQAPAGQPAPAAAAPLFPEPEQKPREPRGENEIQHDFRMAKFTGTIEKVVEDWKDDRNYKLSLVVPSYNDLSGLRHFNGGEAMTFRVLPVQPMINDQKPEEFSDKVPALGVAMIERLEKKSCEGKKGWEKMTEDDLRMEIKLRAHLTNPTERDLVDLANYVFFLWHKRMKGKKA